jgi:hypothetical protein
MPQWGEDYYSNLVIWAFPMALAGKPLDQFVKAGLIEGMMKAANES